MEVPILTPMLVQYLVALCCLRWDPEAIDITIGDMVLDLAAGKERDVDVTVTITEAPGVTHAFKAYEVKHERSPLDVSEVEQLCLKFLDMSSVTHKAIVSSSGFTEPAQAKAAHHGIELYAIKPWSKPMEEQFPVFTMQGLPQECFQFSQNLLIWLQPQLKLIAPESPKEFIVQNEDNLFTSDSKPHPQFTNWITYNQELLLRSTEILLNLEPAVSVIRTFPTVPLNTESSIAVGPAWPHTHTLDVTRDNVHIKVADKLIRLENITINGYLQWQKIDEKPIYYIIERVPDGEPFAGAIVAMEVREGHMVGLILSPKSREVGVHFIRLAQKHKNAIRKLKIELPMYSPN